MYVKMSSLNAGHFVHEIRLYSHFHYLSNIRCHYGNGLKYYERTYSGIVLNENKDCVQ